MVVMHFMMLVTNIRKQEYNMTTWFTSDWHFGHQRILKLCNRPFNTIQEMDEQIIARINEKVQETDTLIHLGDAIFMHKNKGEILPTYAQRCMEVLVDTYISKMNCKNIILMQGNHDKWFTLADPSERFSICSRDIFDFHSTDDRFRAILCHYPLLSWDGKKYGVPMLYGHVHNQPVALPKCRMMDVGVDTNNFYPYSIADIQRRMQQISDWVEYP